MAASETIKAACFMSTGVVDSLVLMENRRSASKPAPQINPHQGDRGWTFRHLVDCRTAAPSFSRFAGSPVFKLTHYPWSTVVDVRFVRLLESYRVTSRDGQAIRLSMHIQGMPQFKAFVLKYSPPEAIAALRARLHKLERL
jgi:hypothetical protein